MKRQSEKRQDRVLYMLITILTGGVSVGLIVSIILATVGGIALAGDWIVSNWEMIKSGSPLYLVGAYVATFLIMMLVVFLWMFLGGRLGPYFKPPDN